MLDHHTVYGIFDENVQQSESNVTMLRQDASPARSNDGSRARNSRVLAYSVSHDGKRVRMQGVPTGGVAQSAANSAEKVVELEQEHAEHQDYQTGETQRLGTGQDGGTSAGVYENHPADDQAAKVQR